MTGEPGGVALLSLSCICGSAGCSSSSSGDSDTLIEGVSGCGVADGDLDKSLEATGVSADSSPSSSSSGSSFSSLSDPSSPDSSSWYESLNVSDKKELVSSSSPLCSASSSE